MPHSRFTNEEIGRRGQEIYEQQLRAKVEPRHKGKYLVVDIETGDYEVGEDYLELSHRLHAKHPDAALYALRIGYPAVGQIGARSVGVTQ